MPRGSSTRIQSALELYRASGGIDGEWGLVVSRKGKARFAPLGAPSSFGMFSKRGQLLALRIFDECSAALKSLSSDLEIAANRSTLNERQAILSESRRRLEELDKRLHPFVREAMR